MLNIVFCFPPLADQCPSCFCTFCVCARVCECKVVSMWDILNLCLKNMFITSQC